MQVSVRGIISALLDGKYFGISSYDNIALFKRDSLAYLLVFSVLTVKHPFEQQDLQY